MGRVPVSVEGVVGSQAIRLALVIDLKEFTGGRLESQIC